MLLTIEYALKNDKIFYYPGYAYEGNSFYDYKKRFSALETLIGREIGKILSPIMKLQNSALDKRRFVFLTFCVFCVFCAGKSFAQDFKTLQDGIEHAEIKRWHGDRTD
jgi:hypothetical protein